MENCHRKKNDAPVMQMLHNRDITAFLRERRMSIKPTKMSFISHFQKVFLHSMIPKDTH